MRQSETEQPTVDSTSNYFHCSSNCVTSSDQSDYTINLIVSSLDTIKVLNQYSMSITQELRNSRKVQI